MTPNETVKPYDLAVYVGRFQPPHAGHFDLIRHALKLADRALIAIGSAGAARRPDTAPFTADEREAMIVAGLTPEEDARASFIHVPDYGDLDRWARAVRDAAAPFAATRIAMIGCFKDATSRYLRAFPEWSLETLDPLQGGLAATDLRRRYFDRQSVDGFLAHPATPVPDGVRQWLAAFVQTAEYADLADEWDFAQRYREAWSAAPYPPVFVTADAVVLHRGDILLIQRKARPGKGLWAVPGGFVEQDELVIDGAIRELVEETGLALSEDELRAALRDAAVFDDPRRDIRGRMITHAAFFHLPDAMERPGASAADDAADLRWQALADLRRDQLYGDHYQIIRRFTRHLTAA